MLKQLTQLMSNVKYPRTLSLLLSFVAGCALPLAFSPYHCWTIAFVSLFILQWLINTCTPKQAFALGYAYGMGSFGTGISWVYIALRYFGNAAPVLALLLTLLLVMYMALFPALASYLQRKYFRHYVITFPCLWVLTEWFRGWFLTGFPWLFVGYSQMTLLGGFAPLGGIYMVSFITVLISSLLLNITVRKKLFTTLIITLVLFGYFGKLIPWTSPNHKILTVCLLQGNIEREFKWDPKKAVQNIDSYVQMTKENWDADLIVWPEGTFSMPQKYGQSIIARLSAEARQHRSTVALGLPYMKNNQYFNSILLIGQNDGLYSKQHLVPFGEFTPLSKLLDPLLLWLQIPMSDYSAGNANQPMLNVNGIKIAPFICYEIVYPALVNKDLPQAEILLTISEDAWYGDSIAVDQHLQMAQMRSLETGRYSLFAVNTGISAVIDQHGHILESIDLDTRGVIHATVPAIDGTTPWVLTGNWPIAILLWGCLVLVHLSPCGRGRAQRGRGVKIIS